MRLYYEALEILPEGTMEETEFIRIDITDMTDTEKENVLDAIKDVMSGKVYRLNEHSCYHDEGGRPCELKEI